MSLHFIKPLRQKAKSYKLLLFIRDQIKDISRPAWGTPPFTKLGLLVSHLLGTTDLRAYMLHIINLRSHKINITPTRLNILQHDFLFHRNYTVISRAPHSKMNGQVRPCLPPCLVIISQVSECASTFVGWIPPRDSTNNRHRIKLSFLSSYTISFDIFPKRE